jgi:hypothetical protein
MVTGDVVVPTSAETELGETEMLKSGMRRATLPPPHPIRVKAIVNRQKNRFPVPPSSIWRCLLIIPFPPNGLAVLSRGHRVTGVPTAIAKYRVLAQWQSAGRKCGEVSGGGFGKAPDGENKIFHFL